MCLSSLFGGKKPKVTVPDPVVVAPPAEPTPSAPVQESAGEDITRKSEGTRSLRIALNIAGPSGAGVNVPGGA